MGGLDNIINILSFVQALCNNLLFMLHERITYVLKSREDNKIIYNVSTYLSLMIEIKACIL